MSGHILFVQKNRMVAFSNYFVRENRTLLKVSLLDMIELESSQLTIPMQSNALSVLHMRDNGRGEDKIKRNGPHIVSINTRGDIDQISDIRGYMDRISYRPGLETYFVRSNKWALECAANTGCIIYDDVGKIFEEAYYSCGLTPPPYFVGDVKRITKSLLWLLTYLRVVVVNHQTQKTKLSLWARSRRPDISEYYSDEVNLKRDIDYAYDHDLVLKVKLTIASMMLLTRHNELDDPDSKPDELRRQAHAITVAQREARIKKSSETTAVEKNSPKARRRKVTKPKHKVKGD